MDPSAAIGIVLLAVLYTLAARQLKRRPTQRQVFFFCLLILAMLITFGPLDELGDERSFWAHMLEHSFQSWIIPPLFLLSVPDWMFRPILMSRPIRPLARFFTNPVVAFVTFTTVYVFAHDPPIFNLMTTERGRPYRGARALHGLGHHPVLAAAEPDAGVSAAQLPGADSLPVSADGADDRGGGADHAGGLGHLPVVCGRAASVWHLAACRIR